MTKGPLINPGDIITFGGKKHVVFRTYEKNNYYHFDFTCVETGSQNGWREDVYLRTSEAKVERGSIGSSAQVIYAATKTLKDLLKTIICDPQVAKEVYEALEREYVKI